MTQNVTSRSISRNTYTSITIIVNKYPINLPADTIKHIWCIELSKQSFCSDYSSRRSLREVGKTTYRQRHSIVFRSSLLRAISMYCYDSVFIILLYLRHMQRLRASFCDLYSGRFHNNRLRCEAKTSDNPSKCPRVDIYFYFCLPYENERVLGPFLQCMVT